MPNDAILLNGNALKRVFCTGPILQFGDDSSKLYFDGEGMSPSVTLSGPQGQASVCFDMLVLMQDIVGDGRRGLVNVTWTLASITPDNQTYLALINNYLAQNFSTPINSYFIRLTRQQLVEGAQYNFAVTFYNKFGFSGQSTISV